MQLLPIIVISFLAGFIAATAACWGNGDRRYRQGYRRGYDDCEAKTALPPVRHEINLSDIPPMPADLRSELMWKWEVKP